MYQFEDGKSVFILIWNICISKPAAIYPFFFKNVLYVSSSGLFLSWEWEWSSWDPSSFSPSSLCETRRKWTPYSTVQHTLQHRSVNCRRSLVYFTVPPLRLSSVCGVFFHLPGGTDERFGAGRVHLRLHGLLREEGERRTCTKPSPPLSFKHFKFIVRCFAVSPGRASHEHGLRGDDVLLGGRPSLPPLPHYHPPHVQRVSSSRPALLHAHRVLVMKPVDFLSTQEVVPQPGAAVGGLLDGPSDRPRPRSGCRWVPLTRKHWSITSLSVLFVAFVFYEWCSCSCR